MRSRQGLDVTRCPIRSGIGLQATEQVGGAGHGREERRYGIRRIWVEHVAPRGPYVYNRPIAVLVGRWTASMGEGVAIGLDGAERATVFGSAMAGLRGATYSRTLERTGITVRVPAERLYHVDGTPREAFVPPFPIASGSSGADAVLEEALRWMQGQP